MYSSSAKIFGRGRFNKFYESQKTTAKLIANSITRSLERLIDKELLIGYGTRAAHKWYIKDVKLTPKGRKVTKDILGQQQKLPFRKRGKPQNLTRKPPKTR